MWLKISAWVWSIFQLHHSRSYVLITAVSSEATFRTTSVHFCPFRSWRSMYSDTGLWKSYFWETGWTTWSLMLTGLSTLALLYAQGCLEAILTRGSTSQPSDASELKDLVHCCHTKSEWQWDRKVHVAIWAGYSFAIGLKNQCNEAFQSSSSSCQKLHLIPLLSPTLLELANTACYQFLCCSSHGIFFREPSCQHPSQSLP